MRRSSQPLSDPPSRRGGARLAVALLAMIVASCGGPSSLVRRSDELDVLARANYRVAVMPFSVSAASEDVIVETLAPLGALLELEGLSDEAPPLARAGVAMRRAVTAHLSQGELAIAELWVTDTELTHAGISPTEARDPAHVERVASALSVDGVLYGDVTRWNRNYLLVESTQEVELELRLIDAGTGQELFFTRRSETRAEGLTGGPTGQISALTAPIAGLTGSTLVRLAREVSYLAAQDLTGVDLAESLDVDQARGNAPRLSFAAVVRDRAEPRYVKGDTVRVVAVGAAGRDVRFHLGRYLTDLPMEEVEAEEDPRGSRATYLGHYVVQEDEVIEGLPVSVTISSRDGRRRTTLALSNPGSITLGG